MAVLGFEVEDWRDGLVLGHVAAWTAAAYCYWIVRRLPLGAPGVIASAPVFVVYACIPLIFNRKTHLVGISFFYCILTWIGSFKVLLLCWGTGPGYDPWVVSSFPRFAVVMTFPAHMKRDGKVVKRVRGRYNSWLDRVAKSESWQMLLLRSALKLVALAILLQILLSRRDSLPTIVLHLLLSVQLYLFTTIVLEILAAVANTMFGIIIEPHFDNPCAAASLEEFWARRWNLLISNTLRETVYNPVLYLLQNPKGLQAQQQSIVSSASSDGEKPRDPVLTQQLGRESQPNFAAVPRFDIPKLVAMLAAFLVSGLAHELLVYYITLRVTWEMNSFFVVQGVGVAVEAAWKLCFPNARPPRGVANLLTLCFAFISAHLLFWPPLDCTAGQVIAEMRSMLTF